MYTQYFSKCRTQKRKSPLSLVYENGLSDPAKVAALSWSFLSIPILPQLQSSTRWSLPRYGIIRSYDSIIKHLESFSRGSLLQIGNNSGGAFEGRFTMFPKNKSRKCDRSSTSFICIGTKNVCTIFSITLKRSIAW